MATEALAHGPWAVFQSAPLMRQVLLDCNDALVEQQSNAKCQQLYGHYTARKPKPTHNRPLPLPDALLQGALQQPETEIDLGWIKSVAEDPWLWKLQWATMALLLLAPALRKVLERNCPKRVAEVWLGNYEARMYEKMLGQSVESGAPNITAALTPLITVVTELTLLRTTYEQ